MNLKQDCQKLKSRIVESPEKLVQVGLALSRVDESDLPFIDD